MCTSTQVSGAGQRRGCRNPGTKTCPSLSSIVPSGSHPSCSFPPQLDGPAASPRDLFFLWLPQENLMAVFSKLFPLKTSYAQRFEYWEATSIWDPFEVFFIVVGGGIQTRDHPGWSLRSCPQQNGGFEVRFLSAKTCHAFESPLSWWRRKSEQAHQAACCLCESSGPAFFLLMWWCEHQAPIESGGTLFLHVYITQPVVQPVLQTFSQSPEWSLVMFSRDGNKLLVCCKIADEI